MPMHLFASMEKTNHATKEKDLVEELIDDLIETYLALRPSPLHGIGVFAIRNIPKGTRTMFSPDNGEWLKLPISQTQTLPDYAQELIKSYCVSDNHFYYVEKFGFKKMDMANFLNHSNDPNIVSVNDGEFFEAVRDIHDGEELLIDYNNFIWE